MNAPPSRGPILLGAVPKPVCDASCQDARNGAGVKVS